MNAIELNENDFIYEDLEELEDQPGTSTQMQNPTGKKKRTQLDVAEKLLLIEKIKEMPCIWDTSHKLHSNHTAVAAAWKRIAGALNKNVDDCKAAWISLKDSRRYRIKTAIKRKSGDGGGVYFSEPSVEDVGDWEFAEAMSFLPNLQQKRKTFNSLSTGEHSTSQSPLSRSSYTYSEATSPAAPFSPGPSRSSDGINSTVLNKVLEKSVNESDVQLTHMSKYIYMDSLLNQLPMTVADDMLHEIICQIKNETIKYRNN